MTTESNSDHVPLATVLQAIEARQGGLENKDLQNALLRELLLNKNPETPEDVIQSRIKDLRQRLAKVAKFQAYSSSGNKPDGKPNWLKNLFLEGPTATMNASFLEKKGVFPSNSTGISVFSSEGEETSVGRKFSARKDALKHRDGHCLQRRNTMPTFSTSSAVVEAALHRSMPPSGNAELHQLAAPTLQRSKSTGGENLPAEGKPKLKIHPPQPSRAEDEAVALVPPKSPEILSGIRKVRAVRNAKASESEFEEDDEDEDEDGYVPTPSPQRRRQATSRSKTQSGRAIATASITQLSATGNLKRKSQDDHYQKFEPAPKRKMPTSRPKAQASKSTSRASAAAIQSTSSSFQGRHKHSYKLSNPTGERYGPIDVNTAKDGSWVVGKMQHIQEQLFSAAKSFCQKNKVAETALSSFMGKPSSELDKLYGAMFGDGDWRVKLTDITTGNDTVKVNQLYTLLALFGAGITSMVLQSPLPWDLKVRLEAALGTDLHTADKVFVEQYRDSLQGFIRRMKEQQIRSPEFQRVQVATHAHKLVDSLVLDLGPHLQKLEKTTTTATAIPYKHWAEYLREAFRTAITVKQTLGSSSLGTFRISKAAIGNVVDRKIHRPLYEMGHNRPLAVLLNVLPAIKFKDHEGELVVWCEAVVIPYNGE